MTRFVIKECFKNTRFEVEEFFPGQKAKKSEQKEKILISNPQNSTYTIPTVLISDGGKENNRKINLIFN